MKLHLPSSLRKALLACLAALALPVTLPTTLATASGIAAAWLVSSQQLTADTVTWTYGDGTIEQVDCSGTEYTVESDGDQGLTDFKLNGLGAGTESFGKFWTAADADQHHTLHVKADSKLQPNGNITCDWGNFFNLGGLVVDALTSNESIFIGRASGEGQHVRFQAATDNGDVKLRIGSNTTINGSSVKLGSNGDWVIGAGKTLEFAYLAATNSHPDNMDPQFLVAEGKTLTLSTTPQGGVGTFNVGLQVVAEGNITIEDSIQADFKNGLTLKGTGSLTLARGSQLTLSGGKLSLEETATLAVSEGGTLTLGDGVTLDLIDNEVIDENWSFGWNVKGLSEETLASILEGATINGKTIEEVAPGMSLEVSEDGSKLVLVGELRPPKDLVWKASGGVWQGGGDTMWTVVGDGEGEDAFQKGDSVTFGIIGSETAQTVRVEGTVAPTDVTVDGAVYTFSAEEGGADDSIIIGGGLALSGTGASATFNLPVKFSNADGASITGTGKVTFAGETSTVTATGLVVGTGVTVEVSAGGTINFGGIRVEEGGTFEVKAFVEKDGGNSQWARGNGESYVHGEGTLRLGTGTGLGDSVIPHFLDGVQGTATLENLELASGTGLTVDSSGNAMALRFGHAKNIWVKSGAGLSINAPVMTSVGVTLHLAGDGATSLAGEGAAGADNGKLASEAAFAVWNHKWGGELCLQTSPHVLGTLS